MNELAEKKKEEGGRREESPRTEPNVPAPDDKKVCGLALVWLSLQCRSSPCMHRAQLTLLTQPAEPVAAPAAAAGEPKKEETDLDALLSDDVAAQRAREASEMAAIEEEERRMKELEVRR